MKKVTISIPEWMIQEIDEITKSMEDEFWNKANTWRQVIKKGIAYWKKTKRGSTSRSKSSATQNKYSKLYEDSQNELDRLKREDPEKFQEMCRLASMKIDWGGED